MITINSAKICCWIKTIFDFLQAAYTRHFTGITYIQSSIISCSKFFTTLRKMTSLMFPRLLCNRDVTDNKIPGSPPAYYKDSSNFILDTVRRADDIITSSDSYRDVPDNKTTDNLPPFNLKDCLPPSLRTMSESLCREEERLKTFDNWPLTFIDKNVLAQTGMYYLGANDNVKCYFCEVEIGRWETTDNPLTEHIRFSPNCPLLRRRTTNNIPLDSEALDRILPPPSYDVCGRSETIDVRPAAYAESSNLSTSTSTSSSFVYPDHPEYAIESARLRSFAEWPRTMKQKPTQLSEAGFFYTGIGDRVKCFSCGGGLKDWDESDDPWEQHALWLTNCPYVKLIRGKSFIDSVIAKYKTPGCTEPKEIGTGSTEILDLESQRTTSVGVGDETGINTERSEEHENNRVSEDKLCKICYGAEYDTAFLPCGHVVACAKCASSVTKCPLCRKPFTNVIRVYFS